MCFTIVIMIWNGHLANGRYFVIYLCENYPTF